MSQELVHVDHERSLEVQRDAIIAAVNRWMEKPHGVDTEAIHALLEQDLSTSRFAFTIALKKAIAQAALELVGELKLAKAMR